MMPTSFSPALGLFTAFTLCVFTGFLLKSHVQRELSVWVIDYNHMSHFTWNNSGFRLLSQYNYSGSFNL